MNRVQGIYKFARNVGKMKLIVKDHDSNQQMSVTQEKLGHIHVITHKTVILKEYSHTEELKVPVLRFTC